MAFDGTITIKANSVLGYERYARTFSPSPAPRVPGFFDINPERRAIGGFYRVRFKVRAPVEVLQDLFTNGLMREIIVADPKGKAVWSGFVYAMSFRLGPVTGDVTIQNVWNRVWMRYRVIGSTTTLRSTRVHDENSLRRYGPREYVMTGGEFESIVQPDQACRLFLSKSAYPKPSYTLNLKRGGQPEWPEPVLEITGAGWIESMAPRVYNQPYTTGTQACSNQIAEIVGIPLQLGLKRDCVAWWKFEEGESVRYEEINQLHLADFNTVGSGQGRQGGCAVFTEANSEYLSRPQSDAPLSTGDIPFSFQFWIYPRVATGNQVIFAKMDDAVAADQQYLFYTLAAGTTGSWNVRDNTGVWRTVACTLAVNSWNHVVVWHDENLNQVGARVNDTTTTTAAMVNPALAAGNAPFVLGASKNGALYQNPSNSYLDELAFWKRLLTAAEVAHLYNSGYGMSHPTSGIGMFIRGSTIEVNSALVGRVFDMDRRGLDVIQDITRIGDPTYRRYLATVDADRYFHYGIARIAAYAD